MFHSTEDSAPSTEIYLLSDSVLISQAQAGGEQAFKVIYERYFDRIYLYLTRMVGKDEVGCELTQDTFLRVWRALPNLRQRETFVSWLYRIATHVAYDYHRREKHVYLASYDEEPTLLDLSSLDGPEDQVVAEEMLQLALARVTWKYRACLVLYAEEWRFLGYVFSRLGHYENAQRAYERAEEIDPSREDVWGLRTVSLLCKII